MPGSAVPWATLAEIPDGVHPWFRAQLDAAERLLDAVDSAEALTAEDWLELKRAGWSDAEIGAACGSEEEHVRLARWARGVRPAYRRIDSCAAEVDARSNYLYSTWGERTSSRRVPGRSVVILGSGPNRIGQGIEFDYCCVHAVRAFRELGFETVMVNCNPETVSTDYDTSDRLYFEPLCAEEVLEICERERPVGVVIQFGGQTPLQLARTIEARDTRCSARRSPRSTSPRTASGSRRSASARARRSPLGNRQDPAPRPSRSPIASDTRCSPGRRTCSAAATCASATSRRTCRTIAALEGSTMLVDRFVEGAVEIDVDALCDGEETYVAAIMQHVEEAGVHSGDSSCVLPPMSLSADELEAVREAVRRLALAARRRRARQRPARAHRRRPLRPRGEPPRLAHGAVRQQGDRCQPRRGRGADRRGRAGCARSTCRAEGAVRHVSVKAAVFPFSRFPGADPVLGPEMRSTGEVMANAGDFATAFSEGRAGSGPGLPYGGHRIRLGLRRGQARGGRARAPARRSRLRAARDCRHGACTRSGRAAGRARAQGGGARAAARRSSIASAAATATSSSTRRRAAARARTATRSGKPRSRRGSRASRRSPGRRRPSRRSRRARQERVLSLQERVA